MMKLTHEEGGRTASIITGIIAFLTYPYEEPDYAVILIALILISNVCNFSSKMSDLDHNETSMPSRGLFSYLIHCTVTKFKEEHRSYITHSLSIPIVIFLIPSYLLWRSKYTLISNADVRLNYLFYCVLLSMFFGNYMHIFLDRFTVAGAYYPHTVFAILWRKLRRKKVNKERYKTKFIHKQHSFVFIFKSPFIKKIDVRDYGKTGGQYEALFRVNLETVNYLFISVLLLVATKPDFMRFFAILKRYLIG